MAIVFWPFVFQAFLLVFDFDFDDFDLDDLVAVLWDLVVFAIAADEKSNVIEIRIARTRLNRKKHLYEFKFLIPLDHGLRLSGCVAST